MDTLFNQISQIAEPVIDSQQFAHKASQHQAHQKQQPAAVADSAIGIHSKHRSDHTVETDQPHCQPLNSGQALLYPAGNSLLCQHSQYGTGYNGRHIDPCSCHSPISSASWACSSRNLRSTCLSFSVNGAVRSRSGRLRSVFSSDFSRRH